MLIHQLTLSQEVFLHLTDKETEPEVKTLHKLLQQSQAIDKWSPLPTGQYHLETKSSQRHVHACCAGRPGSPIKHVRVLRVGSWMHFILRRDLSYFQRSH